jgi:hypothetical protein
MVVSRFVRAATTTLDVNGTGQATLSPDGGDWKITLTSVSVTTNIATPQVSVYANGVSAQQFLEGSFSGYRDASDTVHVVAAGEQLIAVWEGGDPGANATLRVSGWQGRPGEFAGGG